MECGRCQRLVLLGGATRAGRRGVFLYVRSHVSPAPTSSTDESKGWTEVGLGRFGTLVGVLSGVAAGVGMIVLLSQRSAEAQNAWPSIVQARNDAGCSTEITLTEAQPGAPQATSRFLSQRGPSEPGANARCTARSRKCLLWGDTALLVPAPSPKPLRRAAASSPGLRTTMPLRAATSFRTTLLARPVKICALSRDATTKGVLE